MLSIVYTSGQVFSSLKTATRAVASFDFYTPNREDPKSKSGFIFDSIKGKTLVSSGAPFLSQPYMKMLGFLE